MSYIYGVNEFASSGYQIKALQTRLANLNEDNKKMMDSILNTNYLEKGYIESENIEFMKYFSQNYFWVFNCDRRI
mgnify:CR=1 FL=1